MNLNKLMKQAQKMQEQMAKTQSELAEKTVEVEAGGGKVKVVANGAGDVMLLMGSLCRNKRTYVRPISVGSAIEGYLHGKDALQANG